MMRRLAIYISVLAIAILAASATVWAAFGGQARASRVTYEASDTTSKLTFTGDVSFDYAGYSFGSESAEITIDRIDTASGEADLKSADFTGKVSITTPSGGKLQSPTINVVKSNKGYEFSGNMNFAEGNFKAEASHFIIDRQNATVTATRGVSAVYGGLKGLRGDDGNKHELKFNGDGIIYDRTANSMKATKGSTNTFQFDGLAIEAADITISLLDDGLLDLAAAGDIKVSGYGVSLVGLHASYSGDSGELKLWGDVHYTRRGDEFDAREAVWPLLDEGNRIKITGGQGTVDVGRANSGAGQNNPDANEGTGVTEDNNNNDSG